MKEEICLLTFAVIFVTAVVYGSLNLADAFKLRGARKAFLALTDAQRREILELIDHASRDATACTILVPFQENTAASQDDPAGSRFGGLPCFESNAPEPTDPWPVARDTAEPLRFLIQVRLPASLPAPWSDRLLQVFQSPVEIQVRSRTIPASPCAVNPAAGTIPLPELRLSPVRIPGETVQTPLLAYDPYVLLQSIPELRDRLGGLCHRPMELLSLIIAPNQRPATGFELSDIVQAGGDPVWLFDDPGHPPCPDCQRPMRFLFQFGDLTRGDLFGDGGVCYVFGCDVHPAQAESLVQRG